LLFAAGRLGSYGTTSVGEYEHEHECDTAEADGHDFLALKPLNFSTF
jgi:hypothetical protein